MWVRLHPTGMHSCSDILLVYWPWHSFCLLTLILSLFTDLDIVPVYWPGHHTCLLTLTLYTKHKETCLLTLRVSCITDPDIILVYWPWHCICLLTLTLCLVDFDIIVLVWSEQTWHCTPCYLSLLTLTLWKTILFLQIKACLLTVSWHCKNYVKYVVWILIFGCVNPHGGQTS